MSGASRTAALWAGLVIAGSVAWAKIASGSRPRITPGRTRLMLVGDSMAVGLTPPLRQLAAQADVPFRSLAEVGTKIDQWAGRHALAEALATFEPTLTVVVLGTNDAYLQGDAAERQRAPLRRLLEQLRAAGSEVVWVTPPTLPTQGPYPHRRDNGLRRLLAEEVPESHTFPSERHLIPRAPDRLHPTVRGAAAWAGLIWRFLG